MKHVLTKLRIKPGKTEKAVSFLENIQKNHLPEALQTLQEAKMPLECHFVEKTPNGDFLWVMKTLEDLDFLRNYTANSDLPIFDKIRAWKKECFESDRVDLETVAVFDLTLTDQT